jgi:toxin ParE1/3/4
VKVFVSSSAREDILRQFRYYLLEKDAPVVAQRFLDSVESTLDKLSRMPDKGAPKPLAGPMLAGLRSISIAGFAAIRVYYIHMKDELRIVRVLHGKRDIDSLFGGES